MPNNQDTTIQSEQAIRVIFYCILVGFFGSILYSSQSASWAQFFSVLGVALAVAGASLLTGSLLGFLFGIPRTLQHDSVNSPSQQVDSTKQNANESVGYQANTNLEQISDWLTKILVGVGLTQLVTLPESLKKYANFTSSGLGNFASSELFAIAQLIYYLICGFLISYLWTRLHLAGAFYQADLDAIGGKLAKVEDKVSELEKQAERDANALSLVQRQLDPQPNSPPIPQDQLDGAINLASPIIRDQAFNQTDRVFGEYRKDTSQVTKLERTIPILKALIASDTDNAHPEYHGSLGIVLQVQRQPKTAEAEVELTKAIDLRGRWDYFGMVGWEFYRADCRITQNDDFKQGKKSSPMFIKDILADLKAADSDPEVGSYISTYPSIRSWLELNEIPLSDYSSPHN